MNSLLPLVITVATKAPPAKDVKAGWVALVIFILLILAVAVLGKSLITQLKRADKAAEDGKYGPSKPKKQK